MMAGVVSILITVIILIHTIVPLKIQISEYIVQED